MAIRFRRSISIFPGLKLNINKGSVGLTAGVKGAHVGINSKGQVYGAAGIPGSGLSVVERKKIGGGKNTSEHILTMDIEEERAMYIKTIDEMQEAVDKLSEALEGLTGVTGSMMTLFESLINASVDVHNLLPEEIQATEDLAQFRSVIESTVDQYNKLVDTISVLTSKMEE